MALSPTQLSLRHYRNKGALAEVVERWNPHARIRHDLFGFVDVLILDGSATIACQTTSASNFNARLNKIKAHPNLSAVLAAGWQVQVHGWAKKSNRWVLQRETTIGDP